MKNFKNLCIKSIGISLLFASVSTYAGELLQNGDFSSGGTNWSTYEEKGTVSFPSNTAKFEASYGGQNWELQLYQAVNIEEGKTYSYSFKAKSDANYNINFVLEKNGEPYTKHLTKSFSTTSDWKEFSGTFTADASDEVKLAFMKSYSAGVVYFDDVSFAEVEKPQALFIPEAVSGTSCDASNAGRIETFRDGGQGGYYGQKVRICIEHSDYTWHWENINFQ